MCYSLDEIKQKTIPIAKRYGVAKMCIFGSYARGEATEESDVDFYVDKGQLRSLIQYFSFVYDLEKVLNRHVDVVLTGIQDTHFLEQIEQEGILLYES